MLRKFRRLLAVLPLVLCLWSPCGATAAPASGDMAAPPAKECSQAATTVEMRDCYQARFKAADAELDAVYKRLLQALTAQSEKVAQNLRDAQKAWLAFRDAEAQMWFAIGGGGSAGEALKAQSLAALTAQRLDQLKEHLGIFAD